MTRQYPEIRFKSSHLLLNAIDPFARPYFKEKGWEDMLDLAFIHDKIESFEQLWRLDEAEIVQGMCDVFDLEFKQNTIDVYVAPLRNSFSDPMVLGAKLKGDRVVDVLTHEIMHRLLTDNTHPQDVNETRVERWRTLFGDKHSLETLVHIPVHAGYAKLFTDIIPAQERIERDKEFSSRNEPYRLAWEYVDVHGYDTIIDQLRTSLNG